MWKLWKPDLLNQTLVRLCSHEAINLKMQDSVMTKLIINNKNQCLSTLLKCYFWFQSQRNKQRISIVNSFLNDKGQALYPFFHIFGVTSSTPDTLNFLRIGFFFTIYYWFYSEQSKKKSKFRYWKKIIVKDIYNEIAFVIPNLISQQ